MSDSWRAEQRQGLLSESVDAGMDGEPQVTQGPVSEKAVAVSQAHPGAMHLDLRDYLLAAGYAGQDDDAFDIALKKVRQQGLGSFGRRQVDLEPDDPS